MAENGQLFFVKMFQMFVSISEDETDQLLFVKMSMKTGTWLVDTNCIVKEKRLEVVELDLCSPVDR